MCDMIRTSVNGGWGALFKTDEVGQGGRGVQKVSFGSEVFDGRHLNVFQLMTNELNIYRRLAVYI